MKKSIGLGVLIGDFAGLVISLFFTGIFAEGKYNPVAPGSLMGEYYYDHFTEWQVMLIAVIIWALIGVMFSLSSYIYSHTDWSITKMTVIHFIIVFCSFFPLAILAGWFPFELGAIVSFIIIFIIIYIFFWISIKKINQHHVDEINQRLNKE